MYDCKRYGHVREWDEKDRLLCDFDLCGRDGLCADWGSRLCVFDLLGHGGLCGD